MKDKEIYIPDIEVIEEERNQLLEKAKFRKAVRSTSYILIVVASVAVLISTLFLSVLQVSGTSMEPSLSDGEIIVVTKTQNYKVGDLLGFYYQNKLLLKRVIGLPGDYININDEGTVFLNGEELEEPYIIDKSLGISDIEYPYQVPESKVFVLGDNRSTSIDSRSKQIGSIDDEQIVGRVLIRIWPLDKIKFLVR